MALKARGLLAEEYLAPARPAPAVEFLRPREFDRLADLGLRVRPRHQSAVKRERPRALLFLCMPRDREREPIEPRVIVEQEPKRERLPALGFKRDRPFEQSPVPHRFHEARIRSV